MKVERLALFHAVFVLLLNGKNILQAPMENPRLSFWGMREQQKTIQTLPEANSEFTPEN